MTEEEREKNDKHWEQEKKENTKWTSIKIENETGKMKAVEEEGTSPADE